MEQTSGIIRYISPVKAFKKPRKYVIPVRLGIPRKSLSPHFLFLQKPLKTLVFKGFLILKMRHGAAMEQTVFTSPFLLSILTHIFSVFWSPSILSPLPFLFIVILHRYIPASVLGMNKALIRMPAKRPKTTQMYPRSAQILRSRGFLTSFWGFLTRNGAFWPYFPLSFLIYGVF